MMFCAERTLAGCLEWVRLEPRVTDTFVATHEVLATTVRTDATRG